MTAQGEDLLAWLEAAIAGRERLAREAAASRATPRDECMHWWADWDTIWVQKIPGEPRKQIADCGNAAWHLTAHIAANDPASVLRRCAADRKLIALHNVPAVAFPNSGARANDRYCVGCGLNTFEEPMVEDVRDCPVINALAEGYGWTEGER